MIRLSAAFAAFSLLVGLPHCGPPDSASAPAVEAQDLVAVGDPPLPAATSTTTSALELQAIDSAASVPPGISAVRLAPPTTTTTTIPWPTGLKGLPYAGFGLDQCATMNFYREQAGLPVRFSDYPRSGPRSQWGLGWRESNCRNDVTSSTGCCVGFWQIHTGNFTAPGYKARIRDECLVSRRSDILGNDPLQMQKQACVAKVLYDVYVSGGSSDPWRL